MPPYGYGHMVHEHYVERLRTVIRGRRKRIAELKTKADAERYVRKVRAAARRCFAPFPKRASLNARVTGHKKYKRYTLETVVFESRPGFLVTGDLYLPRDAQGKSPGVLGLCGHSPEGKACDLYQSFSQGLANKGFVVFTIDPISQGERRQFYPKDGGARPGLCNAHNLMGNPMVLADDFFGTWRVWDAMRGLDYLLSRPEVDPARVGATGNSGGGTLTTYLTALDPRLTMAAPSCHVSSYLTDLENELPRDAEQNPPGLLAAGLDSADLLLCYAPRPTLILSQIDDFFDERAARLAYEEVRRIHELLGSRNTAAYFSGPREHGYHIENREAMYKFFMKHAGLRGSARESGVKVVDKEKLFATLKGETHKVGSRRAFEFTAEAAGALAKKRGKPSASKVTKTAKKLLSIPALRGAPHYRVLRNRQFAVETEPGIHAIVTVHGAIRSNFRPPTGRVTLYVGHTASAEEASRVKKIKALTRKKGFVSVDPRGIGRTMAVSCGDDDFFSPYGSDYLYACTGELLGESYFGRRVFDVMRAIDFLLANGAITVDLVGRGLGSLTVAFAALLHPSKPRARIQGYLPSYQLLTETPIHKWPLSVIPRGVLRHFDLPDVYRALGKRLKKEKPWGAMMRVIKA